VLEMRRHYTNYFKGLPNFKPYRTRLVETLEVAELYSILDEITEAFTGELVG
jgi:tRNA-dihydrouridine synthase B